MTFLRELGRFLDQRRRDLGVTYTVLAERSGISLATVRRVLRGEQDDTTLSTVLAISRVLGVRLGFEADADVEDLLDQLAQQKARRLVGLVQGSAALEGQGLDDVTRERMVRRTVHELRAGSKRKLWAE